jgi:hypothetical protein
VWGRQRPIRLPHRPRRSSVCRQDSNARGQARESHSPARTSSRLSGLSPERDQHFRPCLRGKVVYLDDERRSVWSICGAERTQTRANDGRHRRFESLVIPCSQAPVVASACRGPGMVERLFATGCRVPLSAREGVDLRGREKRSSPANPKAHRTRLRDNRCDDTTHRSPTKAGVTHRRQRRITRVSLSGDGRACTCRR